ncbi:hypothetical protein F4777DRAFT_510468 [Nemania sp. FL0916]|nr:hypothetical protein F4777DRAFT_510468 [Nemania sp. FL0916]
MNRARGQIVQTFSILVYNYWLSVHLQQRWRAISMEQTFMTIHNLSYDANIIFASDSVLDILGYQAHEVQGKSCFDYFHPDEVPFARSVHNRGVLLDKAAVLHYARILAKDGRWVSCECCFTVVHDVLVACTSIYRRGRKSERRAIEAPQIRRIFSSSPRDPRYHMLEHLSPKFRMQPTEREPRAALILNRFTRTLTIMFATNAVSSILGIGADQLKGKSLYECIAANCWSNAVKCLESAKANDSIAYLRFWSRDPRTNDMEDDRGDAEMADQENEASDNDSDGGVPLDDNTGVPIDRPDDFIKREDTGSPRLSQLSAVEDFGAQRRLSGTLTNRAQAGTSRGLQRPVSHRETQVRRRGPILTRELEAVVSCTSDGLVMVLRRARPPIPSLHPPMVPAEFENGLFAAPWSEHPARSNYPPELFHASQPPLQPQHLPVRDHDKAVGGPPADQLMRSIRDVAVFAWGVVGINGNLASYSHGTPSGESQPPDGLPIWDPDAPQTSYLGPEPPSRYRGDRPTETRSLYMPDSAVRGGQGHTDTNHRCNNMSTDHSAASFRPNLSVVAPPLESFAYSHVQQRLQYAPNMYQNSSRSPWAEVPASFHQPNRSPITNTPAFTFRDSSQSPTHMQNRHQE